MSNCIPPREYSYIFVLHIVYRENSVSLVGNCEVRVAFPSTKKCAQKNVNSSIKPDSHHRCGPNYPANVHVSQPSTLLTSKESPQSNTSVASEPYKSIGRMVIFIVVGVRQFIWEGFF